MQVLTSEKDKLFTNKLDFFLRNYLETKEKIDLKGLWHDLYKNNFINPNNSFLKDILLTQTICNIEPGIGLFLLTQYTCIEILKNFGTQEQKERYLGKLISGELIACFSITEPNAGSDVTMIQTSGKLSNDIWTINGHKIWASNGSIADLIITFVQTKEYKDKTGITCFIIQRQAAHNASEPRPQSGREAGDRKQEIEVLPDTPKLGVKITPSNEIKFKTLKVSNNHIAGKIGEGIKIALSAITLGRIFCAAQATGLLEGCLKEAVKHSTKRNQFGKSISDNQAIQWYLADMSKDLDACKLLLYKAAWINENKKEELSKFSSMAKYFCTSRAAKHANKAVQILGGSGLREDSFVARAYRDSKVLEVYEGTNEIQKVVLSKELELY